MLPEFSISTAESLYRSNEHYPVDLDLAWEWLGYNQKSDCLDLLQNKFEINQDYFRQEPELPTARNPRPKHKYYLTVECFKSMGMIAGTEKGKIIRRYFLECEKIAKEKQKPLSPAEIILQQAQMLVDIERKLSEQEDRLTAIEQTSKAAKEQLAALPPASVEAEPLTTRFALSRLVRSYAIAHNLEIGECWNRLYLEYRDRSHIDLKRRAKSHKPKISYAEYAEKYGYIEPLYAVAHQLFG